MLRKLSAAIALTGLIAGYAYAGATPKTGINGSLHDMNAWAGAGATKDVYGRTCVFCHTPHNAQPAPNADSKAPLWNRADTTWNSASYGWVAPLNQSLNGLQQVEAIAFNTDPLVGPTRLCMSCHDGSIAVDSHASNGAQNGTLTFQQGARGLIADLTITHPIGFKYSQAVSSRPGELVPSTDGFIDAGSAVVNSSSFNTKSRGGLPQTSVKIADVLYTGADSGDYVTCASCHDVHNTVNAASDTGKGYNFFLRARQEGSAICLSCHIK